MDESDEPMVAETPSGRPTMGYGHTIAAFHIGSIKVVQRYACIRRDQFEFTTLSPFPAAFRDYLVTRGPVRGSSVLYILDIPGEFQLTVAANAGRAVFVPRLATELEWQKKTILEIVSALDEILRLV
ncbi:MAG TPA: hypothetical protein PK156_27580 [Polyangium sp.]|nr:hypothetical protein [Polyangium sp.]